MTNATHAVPGIEGPTFICTRPVVWSDEQTGQIVVFPVHHYSDDETGELVLVAEDRFEPILDKLIALGMFRGRGGAA